MKVTLARILVIDDDEVMRAFAVNSLRHIGIQAIEFVQQLRKHANPLVKNMIKPPRPETLRIKLQQALK